MSIWKPGGSLIFSSRKTGHLQGRRDEGKDGQDEQQHPRGSEPGDEHGRSRPVGPVEIAEPALQLRLLDELELEQRADHEQRGENRRERPGPQQHPQTDEHDEDARQHGVPDVPVGPVFNELRRRVQRDGGSLRPDKLQNRPEPQGRSRREQGQARIKGRRPRDQGREPEEAIGRERSEDQKQDHADKEGPAQGREPPSHFFRSRGRPVDEIDDGLPQGLHGTAAPDHFL